MRRLALFFSFIFMFFGRSVHAQKKTDTSLCHIQVALFLDVSGSMEGLLKQAKGQLWQMVGLLETAQKNGRPVKIEYALGTIGNREFDENGFCRIVTPLTSDLDKLSEDLFNISISGSLEYFPYAFGLALDSLKWSESRKDLRIVFIAGNESFQQGPVKFSDVEEKARKKRILLNTIYCGGDTDRQKDGWKEPADHTGGESMSIEQDSAMKKLETIFDNTIIGFNDRFNSTFLPYGRDGENS